MKVFNLMYGVGKIKYLVNFHNGIKTHKDGSPFYDIKTFKNKKLLNAFIKTLKLKGFNQNN